MASEPVKPWVTLDGKPAEVEMVRDVLRFRSNRIVRHLLTSASAGRRCDLNDIVIMASDGLFSTEELRDFYRLIGYSVAGYADLSAVEGQEIRCSLWEKEE